MCHNHSHATVLKRGQAVLTESGELTAYQVVGVLKLELPTGETVTLPRSSIFFVPSPGWVGLFLLDLLPTEGPGMPPLFSMDVDVVSQPTRPTNTMPE